jgi:hypothetical protein
MVTFATYVGLAYDVLEAKGHAESLRGQGTQEENQRFMRQLSQAYNANDHAEATEEQARQFLRANVGPP